MMLKGSFHHCVLEIGVQREEQILWDSEKKRKNVFIIVKPDVECNMKPYEKLSLY